MTKNHVWNVVIGRSTSGLSFSSLDLDDRSRSIDTRKRLSLSLLIFWFPFFLLFYEIDTGLGTNRWTLNNLMELPLWLEYSRPLIIGDQGGSSHLEEGERGGEKRKREHRGQSQFDQGKGSQERVNQTITIPMCSCPTVPLTTVPQLSSLSYPVHHAHSW